MTLLRTLVVALSIALVACNDHQSSKVDNSGSLGVFDPYWDRSQWQWKDIDGSSVKFIKHRTAKDCYIEGNDSAGEVFTDDRITREKKVMFGSGYEIIRTYDETNTLKEVYYSKESRGELSHVLSVFVGQEPDQCLSKAEDILKKYELDRAKHTKQNAQQSN